MDPDKVEARCAKKVSRESEKASGFYNLPRGSATSKFDQFPQIEKTIDEVVNVRQDRGDTSNTQADLRVYSVLNTCKELQKSSTNKIMNEMISHEE